MNLIQSIKRFFHNEFKECHFCGKIFSITITRLFLIHECQMCKALNPNIIKAVTYFAWDEKLIIKERAEIYFFFGMPGDEPDIYLWELSFDKRHPYACLWNITSAEPIRLKQNKPIINLNDIPELHPDNLLQRSKTMLVFS